MEEQDQIWIQWKKYARQEKQTNENELWNLPEKSQNVIEFEELKEDSKKRIRDSHEWPEIAKYYNRYHDVIQHNVSVHAYRMRTGLEPIGKVQYVGNTFVQPIHSKVPKDQQWKLGPGNKESIREVRDKKFESTGEIEEVPF